MKGRRDAGVTDTVRQGRSQGTQGRQAARDWKMLMVNLVYSVYSVAVFKRDKRTSSLVNAVNMRIARAPVLAAANPTKGDQGRSTKGDRNPLAEAGDRAEGV